jgi:hypothetical protein
VSKATIQAVQNWLLSCPYIDNELDEFGGLGVNFLGSEPVQFSIEEAPGTPIVQRMFSGSVRLKNFMFLSRLNFNEEEAQQLSNSGLMEQITDWVEEQNDLHHFPDLGAEKPVRRMEVTSSGYMQAVDATTCKFLFQLAMTYYQPKGATTL